MKTLKSLALSCFLLATTAVAFAATELETKKSKNETGELQKQLQQNIRFPGSISDKLKESSANVLITISAKGEIKVISVACDSQELKNEIIKQLDNLNIAELTGTTEQLVKLTINFKQL